MSWTLTTEAAAKYFGKQVGDEVDASDVQRAQGRDRPVTIGRLRSLQRQFREAKREGNKDLQAAVNRQFGREFTIYLEISGEFAHDVLTALEDSDPAREAQPDLVDTATDAPITESAGQPNAPQPDSFLEVADDRAPDEDTDLIVLNGRDLLAHVWAIAAQLVELNPELRLSRVDQETSMPIYILHDDAEEFRLQFDLVASIWLSPGNQDPIEYSWLDLVQVDLPEAFVHDLRELGVIPLGAVATTTRRSTTYTLISQILDMELHSSAQWSVPNLPIDFSGDQAIEEHPGALLHGVSQAVDDFIDALANDVALMGERRAHQPLWVLERDLGQPLAVFDSSTGRVHLRDEIIDILEPSSGATRSTRSTRAMAAYILDHAQDPREPEATPEQLDRNLAALEESFRVTESVEVAPTGAIDLVKTLDAAGLQAPPMGEFDIAAISRFGDWSWGTRHLSEESLYMFDIERVMSESFEREPFFALCHAGHGINSYGLSLVTSKGPVVAFVQHHWGGAYSDPETQRRHINQTYDHIRTLFDQIEDPTDETRWGLVFSDFRGVCGALDLARFSRTESFEESFTEVVKYDESRAPDEEQLFAFVLGELYD